MGTEPKTKLTIVYSPHYDSEVYLGDAPDEMGTVYVGPKKLMDLLQLRAGIHVNIKSDVEREAEYLNAVNAYLADDEKKEVAFFEGAAKVDPFGVAGKLLRWRDNLIMAGWNVTCEDSKCAKLKALAEIEKYFHSAGAADCWRELSKEYKKRDVLLGMVDKVRFDCVKMDIPFLIQDTLYAIFHRGEVSFDGNCCPQTLDVSKIKLMEFPDVNDAYEWLAQVEQLPSGTVIVNRDNVKLNHTLYTWNSPMVGSTLIQSNPQLLQLFKLSMSIFSRPLNIHNLVSYLQLPMSPIPGDLRFALAKILLRNGGFGDKKQREDGEWRDDWEEAIAQYEFKNKEGKETVQAKAKKLPFLTPIRADYQKGISKAEVADYISRLNQWVIGFRADDDIPLERVYQLNELSSQLSSFSTSLNTQSDIMQYSDIENLILQIYRPMNYQLQQPEAGSMNVISDVRSMAKPARTLIWLDCQQEDVEQDPYDFLSSEEREYLKSQEVVIPDFAQHLEYAHSEQIYKLNQAENIILVKSAYDGTTRLGEHSIVAEASYLSGKKLPKVNPEELFQMKDVERTQGPIDVYKPELAYEVGPISYKGRKESNTSIDTLINLPFNYVMEYVAKLPSPDEEQVKNTYATVGLVAHNFFQHIIEDSQNNIAKMRELTNSEFEQRLESAIDATGLILRLPENASSLNDFRGHLQESMLSLITIMEAFRLTPVGCEVPFPAKDKEALEIDGIGQFGARIDFLMTNNSGQYVIFDFKWSFSKSYAEKIEKDLSIQLELYRQTVKATYPDKEVAGVGYYIMPRKQLLTSDFDELPGKKLVKHIDQVAESKLSEQIKNSFKYRMNEIRNGHIEEAETMEILNVAGYYTDLENKGLCPMSVKEKLAGKKGAKVVVSAKKESESVFRPSKKPSFDKDDKEPSDIPTSHPVLKGRLK